MSALPKSRYDKETGSKPALGFGDLYRREVRFVWRILGRMGIPDADRADACQEVFVVVHRHLAKLKGEESLRSWLSTIARRVAAASRRRAHVRRETVALPSRDLSVPERQIDAVSFGEDRARLDRML